MSMSIVMLHKHKSQRCSCPIRHSKTPLEQPIRASSCGTVWVDGGAPRRMLAGGVRPWAADMSSSKVCSLSFSMLFCSDNLLPSVVFRLLGGPSFRSEQCRRDAQIVATTANQNAFSYPRSGSYSNNPLVQRHSEACERLRRATRDIHALFLLFPATCQSRSSDAQNTPASNVFPVDARRH